eukprot:2503628-Rhodomonas_salina.2
MDLAQTDPFDWEDVAIGDLNLSLFQDFNSLKTGRDTATGKTSIQTKVACGDNATLESSRVDSSATSHDISRISSLD